ncbi:MAG: translation initiation factor IF-3 [Synechococcaceae cyanobacterium SM2_3_1]|nr:translation initiation factor IF-3 [Synechococcaceae cyanobacterium SM2_3_1]
MTIAKTQLINHQIRTPKVLLIDQDNSNRGLIDTQEALQMARTAGLDLVVVSEGKEAPVVRILDYGKLQYQQKKRQKQSARPTVKEVKLRPNVGESDYQIRIDKATEWLTKGNSVKFLVRLRGRENQHRDRAVELLDRVITDLGEVGKVQSLDKRSLIVQVIPA